jgi:CRISPR-associated protein Csd1
MLLRELARYAGRLQESGDLPPQMYQPTRIRWLIELTADGRPLGFVSTVADNAKGPEKRGTSFLAPHIERTSAVKAKLLADRADYVLGLHDEERAGEAAPVRLAACHAAFVERIADCASSTGEPSVAAVLCFLHQCDLSLLPLPDDITPADGVTFRVGDILPIDLPSVRDYWANETQLEGEPQAERVCIICGESRLPAERHPVPIKGIPGGQSSGMQVVSANEAAFESYGLSASLVAPVCYPCAERYAQAANALLRDPQSRLIVGSLVYLFWTREQKPLNIVALLSQPTAGDVKALLASPYHGAANQPVDADAFFVAALASSGGRVAVRDWSSTTVGDVRASLGRYFRLQALVDAWGEEAGPLGIFALAASLVRESRDISPQAVAALLGCALYGRPLPQRLLHQAV